MKRGTRKSQMRIGLDHRSLQRARDGGRAGVRREGYQLSPGLMDTGFFGVADDHPPAGMRRTMLPPDAVAAIGLDAMLAGKPSVIAGGLNKVMAFSNRLTSRNFQAKTVMRMSKG